MLIFPANRYMIRDTPGPVLPRLRPEKQALQPSRRALRPPVKETFPLMRKDIVLPALAVAGGAAAFGLRRWQLVSAYDPETQLFRSGAPATSMLVGLAVLLALAFLLSVRKKGDGPDDFLPAFRCPSSLFMAGMAASAFLFLGAGVLTVLEGMAQLAQWRLSPSSTMLTEPISLLLCGVLCFPAGAGTLMAGRGCYRGDCPASCSLLVLFPPIVALIWLFASHLAHGTDPVLLRYGFSLAAVACLLLGLYYAASFFHCRPHPGRTAFFSLLGIALGLLSLADAPAPYHAALTGACMLSCLAYSCALLRNTFGPPWPERMPSGAQEEREQDGPYEEERRFSDDG